MSRVVAYLRVSTEDQAESKAGLNAQLDACRSHAERVGLELVGPFADEGVSGAAALDARPGLIEALARVGAGDVLLIAKRDRLGRDPVAVAMIEAAVTRQGGRVVSAAGEGSDDDSPSSVLMRRIIDAFAEHERLLIKARTRAALGAKQRRGQRTGNVPLGYALVDDGQRSKAGNVVGLVVDPAKVATMRLVRQLRGEGRSLREIAGELDQRGIPTPNGAAHWSHNSIAKILARPIPGGHDPADHFRAGAKVVEFGKGERSGQIEGPDHG